MDKLRKCVALLSVLLLLTAVRCMANCVAADAHVPPCHRHHAPAPCQNHPGASAYSFQPAVHLDQPVIFTVVLFEAVPVSHRLCGFVRSNYAPLLRRPPGLSSLVLRV